MDSKDSIFFGSDFIYLVINLVNIVYYKDGVMQSTN